MPPMVGRPGGGVDYAGGNRRGGRTRRARIASPPLHLGRVPPEPAEVLVRAAYRIVWCTQLTVGRGRGLAGRTGLSPR
ncbi:hypothetical protein ACWEGE_42360 [Amycolatopsis sp. NPDC004747]